jgi:Fe-S-cluster containining protein
MQNEELKDAVDLAAGNIEAAAAIRSIYAELQAEIDRRKPICVASGKCCNFESYGHRLYVTTLELAVFATDLKDCLPELGGHPLPVIAGRCPLQSGRLCGVHAIRPFGCRIFFCDPTATQWQQDQYEAFHAKIKSLHQQFDIPYFYVEWRQALGLLGIRV